MEAPQPAADGAAAPASTLLLSMSKNRAILFSRMKSASSHFSVFHLNMY